MRISIVKNTRDVKSPVSATLEQVALRIADGGTFKHDDMSLEARIVSLRLLEDKATARDYKAKYLPAFVPSGVFSHRSQEGLEQHSGLICLDFDDVPNVEDLRAKCNAKKSTVMGFVSPGGLGYKVVVQVDPVPKDRWEHRTAYDAVCKAYESVGQASADPKCRNVDRLCYFSYDPLVFYQEEPERIEPVKWDPASTINPDTLPKPEPTTNPNQKSLREWLLDNGIDYTDAGQWTGNYGTGSKFQIDCPFNPTHKRPDAFVSDAGGKWSFTCSHKSCEGRGWQDFKDKLGIKSKPAPAQKSYVGGLPDISEVKVEEAQVVADIVHPFPPEVMEDCKFFTHYVSAHVGRNEICPAYLFAMGITQVGSLLGRSVWIEGQPQPLYPNIYALMLGKSTVSRKSTSKDMCVSQLGKVEENGIAPPLAMTSAVSTPEGLIDMLRTEEVLSMQRRDEDEEGNKRTVHYKERVEVYDQLAEFEGVRLLLHIDEIRSLFTKRQQRSSAGTIAALTEGYNCPTRMNVPSKTSNQTAMYPTINILGCTTMSWFENGIRTEDIHGGFANRFMFFTHEPMPPVPFAESADAEFLRLWLGHLQDVRSHYEGKHQKFTLGESVREASAELYVTDLNRLRMQDDEIILSASARIREQIMKLALIFTVLENDVGDTIVSQSSWEKAVKVGDYLVEVNAHLFGSLVKNERAEDEQRILDALARRDNKATRREIRQSINSKTMDSRSMNDAIDSMLTSEVLLAVKDGRKTLLVKAK